MENSDISEKIKSVASNTKTLGEATFVDATTQPSAENEYFSSARVDRQNARDSALQQLQNVVSSADESSDAKNTASEKSPKFHHISKRKIKLKLLFKQRVFLTALPLLMKTEPVLTL